MKTQLGTSRARMGFWLGALVAVAVAGVLGFGPGVGPDVDGVEKFDGVSKGVMTSGPDVIVGSLPNVSRWGTVGNITAFSVGTTSCNKGDQTLPWIASNNDHPVIGQNLYRLKDGKMEQIGISWLKHGFTALAGNTCGFGCMPPGTGSQLGVGCSDPYSSGLNGDQAGFGNGGLGPRFEVNAATGVFPYPYTDQGASGNAIYKRLQVLNDDLTPALNAGARYFVEGHYITAADSAAGNDHNNASYREVTTTGPSSNLSLIGSTQREKPAIIAWQDIDPLVEITNVDVAGDGRFIVGCKTTDNGDGTWNYEYAVHNLSSDRSGQSFSVPIPMGTTVTGVGFHDIFYHSGEPWDGTDWAQTVTPIDVTWETDTFAVDPNANALRWGTLYNFRFDADEAPGTGTATLGLFKAGAPASVDFQTCVPGTGGPVPVFSDDFESNSTANWALVIGQSL